MTTVLPDGSAFAVVSMPLPKTHWIYKRKLNRAPPAPFLMGKGKLRSKLEKKVREAAYYAIRGATMNGTCPDFDPDALVQNLIVGLFGYHTEDGK